MYHFLFIYTLLFCAVKIIVFIITIMQIFNFNFKLLLKNRKSFNNIDSNLILFSSVTFPTVVVNNSKWNQVGKFLLKSYKLTKGCYDHAQCILYSVQLCISPQKILNSARVKIQFNLTFTLKDR